MNVKPKGWQSVDFCSPWLFVMFSSELTPQWYQRCWIPLSWTRPCLRGLSLLQSHWWSGQGWRCQLLVWSNPWSPLWSRKSLQPEKITKVWKVVKLRKHTQNKHVSARNEQGVPLSFVIGPFLFTLYLNVIINCVSSSELWVLSGTWWAHHTIR